MLSISFLFSVPWRFLLLGQTRVVDCTIGMTNQLPFRHLRSASTHDPHVISGVLASVSHRLSGTFNKRTLQSSQVFFPATIHRKLLIAGEAVRLSITHVVFPSLTDACSPHRRRAVDAQSQLPLILTLSYIFRLLLSPLSFQKRLYTRARPHGIDRCDNDIGLWKLVNNSARFSMSPARGPPMDVVGQETLCPQPTRKGTYRNVAFRNVIGECFYVDAVPYPVNRIPLLDVLGLPPLWHPMLRWLNNLAVKNRIKYLRNLPPRLHSLPLLSFRFHGSQQSCSLPPSSLSLPLSLSPL